MLEDQTLFFYPSILSYLPIDHEIIRNFKDKAQVTLGIDMW